MHAAIPKKYQKYPSTTILKHNHVLAKANKQPYGRLHHMIPHAAYSIKVHVSTIIIAGIGNKKRSKIPLSNEHNSKENNKIIQLCQNLHVRFK